MALPEDSRKKVFLTRTLGTSSYTAGVLTLPATSPDSNAVRLQTLEPPVRAKKPRTIPAGTYVVDVQRSATREVLRLRLLSVEGFSNVNIEVGNSPQDTRGCVLVGLEREAGQLRDSRKAYQRLLEALGDSSEFILVIRDEYQANTPAGSPSLNGTLPPTYFPPIRP